MYSMIRNLIVSFPEGYSDIQTMCFRGKDIREGFDLEDCIRKVRKMRCEVRPKKGESALKTESISRAKCLKKGWEFGRKIL